MSCGIVHNLIPTTKANAAPRDHSSYFSATVRDLYGLVNHDILSPIFKALDDKGFNDVMEEAGIHGTSIVPNPSATSGHKLCDNFLAACSEVRNVHPEVSIHVAFHGTSECNIWPILQNGLDPTRRKAQAHGPGEYFSTRPGRSLAYCRGGKAMLIFAVLVGDQNFKGSKGDIIVVPHTERQLPIAIVHFSSADPGAMRQSMFCRTRLKALALEVERKDKEANIAKYAAKVIQLVIQNDLLAASDFYKKAFNPLTGLPPNWAAEVSGYVRNAIRDQIMVEEMFPGLPSEFREATKSVEKCETDACEAREKLDQAKAAALHRMSLRMGSRPEMINVKSPLPSSPREDSWTPSFTPLT